MKENLKNLFRGSLIDLGQNGREEFQGIYSPIYEKSEIKRFMTSHYESLKGARTQAKEFDLTDRYFGLISEALKRANFSLKYHQRLTILDVGSGFGSTTFPLLKLFPKSRVVAGELSAAMLVVLKEKLAYHKKRKDCLLLQLNAENLNFKKNSFDLICGAAILHHLFRPEKTLRGCAKILKPGGIAIFFEPFEEGTSMMALIYEAIIHHSGFKWLDFSLKYNFRKMVATWQKMKNEPKNDPFFRKVDDKWLFSKKYFEGNALKYGFRDCIIYRLDKSKEPFTHLAQTHLAKKIDRLPKWIFETIKIYENWFSDDLKDELITEGCIILKKND